VCRYVGTGRSMDVPCEHDASLIPVLLIGSGAHPGEDEQAAAADLYATALRSADYVPVRFEQVMWALWSAVYAVDLRPFDQDGQRVSPDACDATWFAAAEQCAEQGIRAWCSVRWEQRTDA
jgi:hypothetical protein